MEEPGNVDMAITEKLDARKIKMMIVRENKKDEGRKKAQRKLRK